MTKPQAGDDELTKSLRLVALTATAALPFKSQIWLMSRAGFQPAEIARLLDTTANSVNVRLSEMRKNKQGRGRGAKNER